jgi:hypothetical protein
MGTPYYKQKKKKSKKKERKKKKSHTYMHHEILSNSDAQTDFRTVQDSKFIG